MSDDPYQWKPWLPEFTKPLDQRIKQEVPCMDTASKSKPPEGTPTPSTDSLPSYQEWCDFFKTTIPRQEGKRHDPAMIAWMAAEAVEFLAQRGSPP